MNVALRPMRQSEFPDYLAAAIELYARDMVENAGLDEEVARRKSAADHERLFPAGLETPGLTVLVIEADGEAVGHVLLGEQERHASSHAFLYDIVVDPAHRGEGLGRKAMELIEGEARARGHDRIELNVFGGNKVARSLYRSLGYRETFVTMAKGIG